MRQVQGVREQNGFKAQGDSQFKNQVINGIIAQTLTSWEALARKYEEKPPFDAVYRFYCRHRMIKLLEERLFAAEAAVSKEEVATYYQQNLEQFTKPEMISLAIIEGSTEDLESLWLEAAMGGDFQNLGRQRTGHDVPVHEIPANHLNRKVMEVIGKLTKKEVSQVFEVDGHLSLVQFIDRKPAEIMALAKVGKNIEETLHGEKLKTLREKYLEKLRLEQVIEISEANWQNLRKELEHRDEKK